MKQNDEEFDKNCSVRGFEFFRFHLIYSLKLLLTRLWTKHHQDYKNGFNFCFAMQGIIFNDGLDGVKILFVFYHITVDK